jgi:hypothetical protein
MADQNSPFSQEALPINQSGRLSDEQAQRWGRIAKRRRRSAQGLALPFAAIGALLLIANGPPAKAVQRHNTGLAFLAIAAALLVVPPWEPVNADVREGRLESVEGAIAKRTGLTGPGPSSSYSIIVGGRRLRASSRASFAAAPDAGYVRVYFLPRSCRVVNLEQLPDPPIPTGSGAAQEILQDFARALISVDGTAIAEASAQMAALKHVVEGPPTSASDRAHASGLHADDLYGTWTNPILTISFMKNGIATMTPAFGGARREGHWSVDRNGRLLTDMSGAMEPIEASRDGDRLVIVFEGQRVTFTRSH